MIQSRLISLIYCRLRHVVKSEPDSHTEVKEVQLSPQQVISAAASDSSSESPSGSESDLDEKQQQRQHYEIDHWVESKGKKDKLVLRRVPAPVAPAQALPSLSLHNSFAPLAEEMTEAQSLPDEVANAAIVVAAQAEPATYAEAMASPQRDKWKSAMDNEMDAHKKNTTWILFRHSEVPPHKTIMPSKWIYKLKLATDGHIARYKARVVAKGFRQKPGLDYYDTYAPVMYYRTLRALLSIAATQDLEIKQFDITTAFLNAPVKEDLYMELPHGFKVDGMVAKLQRAIYGIKQAPHAWNHEFNSFLLSLGFKRFRTDLCVYLLGNIILGIFVDDVIGLLPFSAFEKWEEIKAKIFKRFPAKDIGDALFILGMRITRDRKQHKLFLDQELYIDKITKRFREQVFSTQWQKRNVHTPIEARFNSQSEAESVHNEAAETDSPYLQIVGSLLYAAISSRPDMAYTASLLARYSKKHSNEHMNAACRALRYLACTKQMKLVLGGNSLHMTAYSDSDYAGDQASAKSQSGVITLLGDGAIDWSSKLQSTVALSSMEAEYAAMAHAVQDVRWLCNLLTELNINVSQPILMVDNMAAIQYSKNGGNQSRTRHVNVKYHFVREQVEARLVQLRWIDSKQQVADIFTKPLARAAFEKLCSRLLQ